MPKNLPEGLKLDKKTGIIKGEVAEKGTYKVMLKAENALGSDTWELLIKIGDELLLTPQWDGTAGIHSDVI